MIQGGETQKGTVMVYKVLLIHSDEGYAVSCPELPGCHSQGESETEALANITVAIREWRDLPDATEVELVPVDPGDELDEADRAALHQALREPDADVVAGRLVDAADVLRRIGETGGEKRAWRDRSK